MNNTTHEVTHPAVFSSRLSLPLRTRFLPQPSCNMGRQVTLESSRNKTPSRLFQNIGRMEQIFSCFEVASSAHKYQDSTSIRTRPLAYSVAVYTEWRKSPLTLHVLTTGRPCQVTSAPLRITWTAGNFVQWNKRKILPPNRFCFYESL